ncbi:membrane protein insertion efficiency factor YidD [Chlorobaculum sp. MV4-Y]|uniref:membrane protein insertion efficiency factor YidD n=1 Tax=Chlorobaculum sp. MV4-Y TaxID=2976335 RepID=UPI0039832E32
MPIFLIKFYQTFISPLLGPSCKYHPTCSNYAIDAFRQHNLFYATWLTVWRVLRCNPFSKGGYDPVPPKKRDLKVIQTSRSNGQKFGDRVCPDCCDHDRVATVHEAGAETGT